MATKTRFLPGFGVLVDAESGNERFLPGFGVVGYREAAGGDTNISATTDALVLAENAATITLDVNVGAGVDALTLTEFAATVDLSTVQVARPDADTAAGSWVTIPLWSKVDEDSTGAGDGVEITSDAVGNNTNTTFADIRLSDVSDPGVSTGHIIRVRWRHDQAASRTLAGHCELWEGVPGSGTKRASIDVTPDVTTTENLATLTLSSGEADSITNYADLYLRLWGRGTVAGTARSLIVEACEFEVPVASGDANISATTDALVLAEQAATIVYDVEVLAGVDALALVGLQASVDLGINVLANVHALTITEAPATIIYDVDVLAGFQSLTLTGQVADVALGVNIAAGTDALALTEFAASIANDVEVLATVDALTLTTNQATIANDVGVQASTDALTLTEQQASIALDVDIAASTDALTLATFQAGVAATVGTDIAATTATLVLTNNSATVTLSIAADYFRTGEWDATFVRDGDWQPANQRTGEWAPTIKRTGAWK